MMRMDSEPGTYHIYTELGRILYARAESKYFLDDHLGQDSNPGPIRIRDLLQVLYHWSTHL